MAWRLGEYVVYGELRNKRNLSTHGIIVLRGAKKGKETILHLELTGNCDSDLFGKGFRFEPGPEDRSNAVFRPSEHKGLQPFQIGTTGSMTAQGWVRALPCPPEEFMRRKELGEPPPTPWTRRLYLEWYSQNGRVVVEMAGAVVEELVREREGEDDGVWAAMPNVAPHPDTVEDPPPAGLSVEAIRLDGDDASVEGYEFAAPDEEDEEEDPFDDGIEVHGLMDYCVDHGEERPLASFMGDFRQLPPPEELDDEQLEIRFKCVLGQLAMIGVAYHVCEHYTMREAYGLLREKVLTECGTYEELIGTGWTQNFCTSDYCKACDAEAEETVRRMETERN